MEAKISSLCSQHNSALSIYCGNCQKMICLLCITEHSKKGHELMSPIDYCKTILHPQICEQLAILEGKNQIPNDSNKQPNLSNNELIDNCTENLEQLISYKTDELKIINEIYNALKGSKSEGLPSAENLEKIMKRLIEQIAKFENEVDVPAAISLANEFKMASEQIKELDIKKTSDLLISVKNILDAEKISSEKNIFKMRGILNLATEYLNEIEKFKKSIKAKFAIRPDEKLWTITDNGLTCMKSKENSTITICSLDQPLINGNFIIEYQIERLSMDDAYDSIGIATKDAFRACAFYETGMYGLIRSIPNKSKDQFIYPFKQGDNIKLEYCSVKGTLDLFVNKQKVGCTILNIPQKEYYTGVAFRNTNTAIKLINFTKY